MSTTVAHVDAVRRFSRLYLQRIGALAERPSDSPFSLTETRILYEIGHRDAGGAAMLARDLGLDEGFLSRKLAQFEARGLVTREASPVDNRRVVLRLTQTGRDALSELEAAASRAVSDALDALGDGARDDLIASLGRAASLLGQTGPDWRLRGHGPGDIGWVISRHGALYAQEFGWDLSFEALVAEIAGGFLRDHDPAWERCWIAERDGVRLGCVFLARQSDEVAKLRLLLVEPSARGVGLGRALVQTCIDEARRLGYRRLTLWTNDVLRAARAIYSTCGFTLTHAEPAHAFGRAMASETWDRDLS